MVETSINTLLSRIIVTIQHSEKGSLSFLIGESTSLKRFTDLLDKQLAEKGKLTYDISKPSQPLLSFLESTKGDFDTPVVYVLGFDKVDGQHRLNFYKYLNFHRESLREIEVNYIFLMDRDYENEFLQFAPDLASIRSGAFYLPEQARRLGFQDGLVRILDIKHEPVGAGFMISDNQVITCAHLILIALGSHPDSQEKPKGEIAVDFPFLEPKGLASGVIKDWNRAADIAILDLKGDLPKNRQPVELISETNLSGHNFRTFGFPDFAESGIWSSGEIVNVTGDKSVMQLSDKFSSGFQLQKGFSGAPVWDDNLQGVVGMILSAERDISPEKFHGQNVKFVPVSKILEIYNPLAAFVPKQISLIRDRYLSHIERTYRALDFKGMPQLRNSTMLPLEDIYVPLLARPELPKGETWERRLAGRSFEYPILAGEWEAAAIKEIKEDKVRWDALTPVHIEETLLKENRVVVLGDPGSGKSTLLRYLTLLMTKNSSNILPILVPLNAYERVSDNNAKTLREFLAEYYERVTDFAGLDMLFDDAVSKGQALIMLDGLDEILRDRSVLVKKIDDFADEMIKKGNHVIVTSRIVGYRVAPLSAKWSIYALLDLTSEEIEVFVKKWCIAFAKANLGDTPEALRSAQKESSRILDAIKENPGIARLASNPLLLTILALISRQWAKLPESRVSLYDRYLETLIESWNRARSLDKSAVGVELDYESTLDVLGFLALRIHENSPHTGLATTNEIEKWLIEYFESENRDLKPVRAKEKSREFLQSVRLYSNLLVERGQGLYGFIHLTFEEMLAAYGLVQIGQINLRNAIEYIRKYVADPAWREIILLFVGILGVLNRTPRFAGEVVRAIMDINVEKKDEGLNIVLAGYCLADVGEKGIGANVADEVKKQLIELHHDSFLQPHIQSEAGNVLGRARWKPDDLDEFITVHRGKFLFGSNNQVEIIERNFSVGKYPITNVQYKSFIEDNGYSNQRFWTVDGWRWLQENEATNPIYWESTKWNNPLSPVVGISWYEANAYCKWLSEKIERNVFLPTAKQWERVARGKEGRNYPWGNQLSKKALNSFDYWKESDERATTVVTQFPMGVSVDGVYDLCGNVWEWTSFVSGKHYVVYGGSWAERSEKINALLQNAISPATQSNKIGFRVFADFNASK